MKPEKTIVEAYSDFISTQQNPIGSAEITDPILEALNELGEDGENEALFECMELLDLVEELHESEKTTSALQGKMNYKGEAGAWSKSRGESKRQALLNRIQNKAETEREKLGGAATTKDKKARQYWDRIALRAAALRAKEAGEPRSGSSGNLDRLRSQTNKTEGSSGKKAGDTWQTETGHFGGKNSAGEIRYFRSAEKATEFSRG